MSKHSPGSYRFSRRAENLIANLRGVPEDHSPIVRETRALELALDRILSRYKIGEESIEDRIRENWGKIVGPEMAQHCQPSRIERESILVIAVSNPVMRQELQFNSRIILKNLSKLDGGNRFRQIVFKSG